MREPRRKIYAEYTVVAVEKMSTLKCKYLGERELQTPLQNPLLITDTKVPLLEAGVSQIGGPWGH